MPEQKQTSWARFNRWVEQSTTGKGGKKDHENFLENLSMLYESGMGLVEALSTLSLETKDKGMQQVIGKIKQEVSGGGTLWQSLEKSQIVPTHYISLIRIGEDSGQLAKNLQAVVIQQKKESEFRSKIRSAMLYPLLVLIVTVGVGLLVTWFILPRLARVFDQLNLDLPFLTRALIGSGDFLQHYGWFAVPTGLALLLGLLYLIFFYPKTKQVGQQWLLRSFITRKLIQEMELARFGYVGGTLLKAGMPIEKIMEALEHSTNFITYKAFYRKFKDNIEKGASFQQAFKAYKQVDKLIPLSVQQMINSAYYSGHLSQTLMNVGEKYELRMENSTKNLPIILEPVLLVVIWLGVVAVAMAVILPIYDLVGGFNLGGTF